MSRKFVWGLLLGWAIAILFSPRDVLKMFRPSAA